MSTPNSYVLKVLSKHETTFKDSRCAWQTPEKLRHRRYIPRCLLPVARTTDGFLWFLGVSCWGICWSLTTDSGKQRGENECGRWKPLYLICCVRFADAKHRVNGNDLVVGLSVELAARAMLLTDPRPLQLGKAEGKWHRKLKHGRHNKAGLLWREDLYTGLLSSLSCIIISAMGNNWHQGRKNTKGADRVYCE